MIIALVQRKGGSGKTSVATNIAAELANRGHSVGLLDTDPQLTATTWFKRRVDKHPERPALECKQLMGDIGDTVDAMAKRNDFLLIDTAGFDSNEGRRAMVAADIVLCPFRPKQYDLDVASGLKNLVDLAAVGNPKLKLVACLNSSPTNANDRRAAEAHAYLSGKGYRVLNARLFNRESYGDAGQVGLGATEYDDKKASAEVQTLVDELLEA